MQRECTKKEEAASLTVRLDSIFKTAAIEAHEDVAVIDLPRAFLHASMEGKEEVIMVMED